MPRAPPVSPCVEHPIGSPKHPKIGPNHPTISPECPAPAPVVPVSSGCPSPVLGTLPALGVPCRPRCPLSPPVSPLPRASPPAPGVLLVSSASPCPWCPQQSRASCSCSGCPCCPQVSPPAPGVPIIPSARTPRLPHVPPPAHVPVPFVPTLPLRPSLSPCRPPQGVVRDPKPSLGHSWGWGGTDLGVLVGLFGGVPSANTPPTPRTSPALLFDGSTNPAHPKHIGSIDPHCSVANVVRGLWGRGGRLPPRRGGARHQGGDLGGGGGVQSFKVPLIFSLLRELPIREPSVSRAGRASAKGCLCVLGSPQLIVGSLKMQNVFGGLGKRGAPKPWCRAR